mmetsp:Transcript_60170/g.165338  ORF Transcript_60170/g.165338 Transcript_60170/m.165338 type:complete len:201 (-) Transcript_60170:1106-1708(-)
MSTLASIATARYARLNMLNKSEDHMIHLLFSDFSCTSTMAKKRACGIESRRPSRKRVRACARIGFTVCAQNGVSEMTLYVSKSVLPATRQTIVATTPWFVEYVTSACRHKFSANIPKVANPANWYPSRKNSRPTRIVVIRSKYDSSTAAIKAIKVCVEVCSTVRILGARRFAIDTRRFVTVAGFDSTLVASVVQKSPLTT